jgi:hypothetical protein
MSRLDDLPPDLRATLSLLVDRGKSYAQVADMLAIPESAVRDRAHAALDALAGDPAEPAGPRPAASERPPQTHGRPAAFTRASTALPSSRRGGALLLATIVVVVVVAIVLITSSGGSGSHKATSTSASNSTTSSASKTPTVDARIGLTSPNATSKAIGIVEILSEGSKRVFLLGAKHLPPSKGFFYAVWLYNSPSSEEAVSKIPTVGSNGQVQGGALLPSNAGNYHEILLTRETSERTTQHGPIVLSGTFALH